MPRYRNFLAIAPARVIRSAAEFVAPHLAAMLATITLLTLAPVTANAQGSGESGTPLHLAASRFEFVASGDSVPVAKLLRVHNGGTARFSDVRVTRLAYADSVRGAAWLVVLPRQTTVAPDELAIVSMLCIDPAGLAAGTYHATAAVAAREVPQPVAFTMTLVVTDAEARARHAAGRCRTAVTK